VTFLSRVVHESRRRNLLGTLGIFVGGGWALLQVLDLFIERGFLPEWTFNGAVVALVLGLPVVLATAYAQAGRRLEREGKEAMSATEEDLAELLTWNRAILGGVLAFALLGVVTTGYMVMRVTGIGGPGTLAAQGSFEVGGEVVLADFESSVGEDAPSDLITEALRIDLEASEAFELVDKAQVVATQERMVVDPAEPLTEEMAREVAVRRGATGVVSGEIGRVGSSYVLTSRLIRAETGEVLAPFRATADGPSELLGAIDALADQMRTKVGESLRSVAASEPLSSATTTSLEALKKYTYVASRVYRSRIDPDIAKEILEEAVSLDSTFAIANLQLAIAINNWGGSADRAWQAASQAYRHRERLSERERYAVEAYYARASGDVPGAAQAYRRMIELDPTGSAPVTNLADILMYAGDYRDAVDVLLSTPSWDNVAWTWNLMVSQSGAGRLDEARAVVDSIAIHTPESDFIPWQRALLDATAGDLARARTELEGAPAVPAGAEFWASVVSADVDVLQGSLDAAQEKIRGAAEYSRRFGSPDEEVYFALYLGWLAVWPENDPEGVEDAMGHVLDRIDMTSWSVHDQALPTRALIHAMAGADGRVDVLARRYREEGDAVSDPEGRAILAAAEALAEVRRGERPLEHLETTLEAVRCARCADLVRGFGAELAGRPERAIEAYERYLAHPFFDAVEPLTHIFATNVHERLGPLYEEVGQPARAAQHYREFADRWEKADARLRGRVEHARTRAEELTKG